MTERWAEQNGIYHDVNGVPWRRRRSGEALWERWSDSANEYVDAGPQPLAEALLEQIREVKPPKQVTVGGHTWTHQAAWDEYPAVWYCDTIHEAFRHDGEQPQRELYEDGHHVYEALTYVWRLLGS